MTLAHVREVMGLRVANPHFEETNTALLIHMQFQLRMLKLDLGKGHQVTNVTICYGYGTLWNVMQCAQGMCSREL